MLVLVVGVPILLVELFGSPIPADWSWDRTLTDDALLGVLACLAWLLWVQLAVCLLVEVLAEIRIATGRSADWLARIPGTFGGQQLLARSLVQAVVAIGVTSGVTVGPPTTPPVHAAVATAPPVTSHHTAEPSPASYATEDPEEHRATEHARHTTVVEVAKGDTLWSIAEERLGSGELWRRVADLNRGRLMPDGTRFRDAGTLQPGWTLVLPAVPGQSDAPGRVTVHSGDTLWGLARTAYGEGDDWPRIYRANRDQITDPDLIYPGQRLTVPGGDATPGQRHSGTGHEHRRRHRQHQPDHHATDGPTGHPTGPLTTSPTPAPSQSTSGGSHMTSDQEQRSGHEAGDPSALTKALIGGGSILAAGLFAGLLARRRAQFRVRRSGRTIPRTPEPLVRTERTVRSAGSAGGEAADFLDRALRELAAAASTQQTALPEVQAASIDEMRLDLLLDSPANPPPTPWSATPDRRTWSLSRSHHPENLVDCAPYPTLVAVGSSDNGATWFIDLEAAGLVQVTGDRDASTDLARFIAAELAMNRWSSAVDVTVTKFAEEVVPLNPTRARVEPKLDIERLTKAARRAREATDLTRFDVLAGRLDETGADSWMPKILVTDASERADSVGDAAANLLDELAQDKGRGCVALVIASAEPVVDGGVVLTVSDDGQLTTPWGTLSANRLGGEDAAALAALFTAADAQGDEPMPRHTRADGSSGDVDVAGALAEERIAPRSGTGDPDSLLPRPDHEYIESAATTVDDLAVLAPRLASTHDRSTVAADPDLDDALKAWADPNADTPRLRLLGPVEAQVIGDEPHDVERRKAYYTELLAYLAAHPAGVTPPQLADAFAVQPNTIHSRMATLRQWLGTDHSGEPYLPESTLSAAARSRGIPVYQLNGVLCDADLFRRLRARGQAKGPDGIKDLVTALDLVSGTPFDQLRPVGYRWLSETPIDHHLTAAIVDVAHVVATYGLAEGDPALAIWAAETAIDAAPSEDKPRLDLAHARRVQGHTNESDAYVDRDIIDRSDDEAGPPPVSARTADIVRRSSNR